MAVGCGVAMPARLEYQCRDDDFAALDVKLEVRYEPLVMKYVLHGLTFVRDTPDVEVTGTVLRTVPVHELLKRATSKARVKPLLPGDFKSQEAGSFGPSDPNSLVAQGPSDETLLSIARHYRVAEVIGLKPALYVQSFLGIPYPTVSNWISRAKTAGFFPTTASIAADAETLKMSSPEAYDEGQNLLLKNNDWGSR